MLLFYLVQMENEEERKKISEIYLAHRFTMLHTAMRVLGRDSARAEDAVHSAMEAIIKNKEKYFQKSCKEMRGWCVIIVKNKCIDILRREKNYNYQAEEDFYDLESKDASVEEQVVKKSEFEHLKKCMRVLSEQSRNALEMKYVAQMSTREIAKELNLTEEHVSTILYRAKMKVREEMMREEAENGAITGN